MNMKLDLSRKEIFIYDHMPSVQAEKSEIIWISTSQLFCWVKNGSIVFHLFQYKKAHLHTYRLENLYSLFLKVFLIRLLSYGTCYVKDELESCTEVTGKYLVRISLALLINSFRKKSFVRKISEEISQMSEGIKISLSHKKTLRLSLRPVYLRTDLCFGLKSGGSLAHIGGVLNQLDKFSGSPIFLTSDYIPTVKSDIAVHRILPPDAYGNDPELVHLYYSRWFTDNAIRILDGMPISFIYQRYSLNNYSGLVLSKRFKVPFVLEYNGSEVWISKNWARPLKYENLADKIEYLNLQSADLIVSISNTLKKSLVERGVCEEKVLVNPNGVDVKQYSPYVDGTMVKDKYKLEGKIVIGFIGTFGRWHGAKNLALAYGKLLEKFPRYRDRTRLLMIGNGETMPEVEKILDTFGVKNEIILTGLVPQNEGPHYLAACDILVSPHVPNSDGTAFFGSPTKLFEYMAMEKGIVASNLDQIGEVLTHGESAWLVKPGETEALMDGLQKLIEDRPLRERLGAAARKKVLSCYTWEEHARKIIEQLEVCCE